MTPSDSGDPGQQDDNPFDLGLPMLRVPAGKAARKRSTRRGTVRRRRRDPLNPLQPPLRPLGDPGGLGDPGPPRDSAAYLPPTGPVRPEPAPLGAELRRVPLVTDFLPQANAFDHDTFEDDLFEGDAPDTPSPDRDSSHTFSVDPREADSYRSDSFEDDSAEADVDRPDFDTTEVGETDYGTVGFDGADPRDRASFDPGIGGLSARHPGEGSDGYPLPEDSFDRSADWEQWLDPVSRDRTESVAPVHRIRVPHGGIEEGGDNESGLVPSVVDRSGGNAGPRLRHHPRPRRDMRRSEKPLAVLLVLGIGIVVIAVVLTVIHTGRHRHPGLAATAPPRSSAPVVPPAPTSDASIVASQGCETRRGADVVSGTDPGGTASGPDAILAFERAYYVQRSGSAARAVVAADSSVPAADQIQRGINQIPVGTRYCVQITRAGSSQWEVRLSEQKPGADLHTFTQVVTTRTEADRTLIVGISAA